MWWQQQRFSAQGRWQAIAEQTAVVEVDVQGAVREVNARFCDLLGYQRAELIGQPQTIFYPPEYVASPAFQANWRRLCGGEFVQGTAQRRCKNGTVVWVQGMFYPVRDARGRVERIVGLVYDVTATQEQTQRAHAILQAIERSMGVIEFDLQGHVLRANDHFLHTMGYTRQNLVGQHHRILCPPAFAQSSDYPRFWDDLRAGVYSKGKIERVDARRLHGHRGQQQHVVVAQGGLE
ncbi:MAG: PAS domain S-box protein, partial [Acidovorax sp.]|nr:PAS domain S-box protein [Acidovorax sp.]